MSIVLIGVLAYVSLQVLFGFFAARWVKSEEDYLLGGRKIGPALTTFSLFATWFGAETCIGAASQAYAGGLDTLAIEPFGYGSAILLMGLLLAVPLWKMRLTTLGDLYRMRYGTSIERLSVLMMVPTSVLWAAAQIRAFGQILAGTSSIDVQLAVTVAAAVVIVYTATGGFLADTVSDLVQGLVLGAGLIMLMIGYAFTGPPTDLMALPAERLRLVAQDNTLLDFLERLTVPMIGSLVAQELVARVSAARSARVARNSAFTASGMYMMIGLIPVGLGLAASQSALVVDHPEQVLIRIAETTLPLGLYVIFAGALVSAILSTVDSALLVSGSLIAHNVILRVYPGESERTKVRINRAAVVALGLVAYALTFSQEGVWGLVLEASGFGSAGLVVTVLFGLYSRFGGALAAASSLIAGVVVYFVGAHVIGIPHPFLTSLLAAFLAYLGGALIEVRRAPAMAVAGSA